MERNKNLTKDQLKTRRVGIAFFIITLIIMFYLIPSQIMVPSTVKMFYMSPAFLPRILTITLAVLALTLVFWPGTTEQIEEEKDEEPEGFDLKKVIVSCLILFVYAFVLIELLGFLTATILVLAGLMLYAGNRNYRSILLISILVPSVLVLFFTKLAYVPFPKGIIIPW